jgi:hypothetical protein
MKNRGCFTEIMNYVRWYIGEHRIRCRSSSAIHGTWSEDRPRELRELQTPDHRGQLQDVRCECANGTPSIIVGMSNTIGGVSKAPNQNVIQETSGFQRDPTAGFSLHSSS